MNAPEGSCTTTVSPLVTTVAYVPAVLTNLPPSPGLASRLWTRVPSGMLARGMMLPGFRLSWPSTLSSCPTISPSTAMILSFFPFSNWTSATGLLRPGACTMSVTFPTFNSARGCFISPTCLWLGDL